MLKFYYPPRNYIYYPALKRNRNLVKIHSTNFLLVADDDGNLERDFNNNEAVTISFWVRLTNLNSAGRAPGVGGWDSHNDHYGYHNFGEFIVTGGNLLFSGETNEQTSGNANGNDLVKAMKKISDARSQQGRSSTNALGSGGDNQGQDKFASEMVAIQSRINEYTASAKSVENGRKLVESVKNMMNALL